VGQKRSLYVSVVNYHLEILHETIFNQVSKFYKPLNPSSSPLPRESYNLLSRTNFLSVVLDVCSSVGTGLSSVGSGIHSGRYLISAWEVILHT
jgi:hypothetical protein